MLTEKQKKFIELTQRYEKLKEEMKAIKPTMDELMKEFGPGTSFQDPRDLTVYVVEEKKGQYVYFEPLEYKRTKKTGETKGGVSMKKAEEMGFKLTFDKQEGGE